MLEFRGDSRGLSSAPFVGQPPPAEGASAVADETPSREVQERLFAIGAHQRRYERPQAAAKTKPEHRRV